MNTIQYYIVYNENTLGYLFIDSNNKKRMGILRASILKGSTFNELSDPIYINDNEFRKATVQDFENYNIYLPCDFITYN